ncbi:hypothetical protein [Sanyastnella coralliicola]|uniref:hypothetical protein n=1 Tax=Sanyastnella coralliicola TaxID=3069118 RepID=UPI0027BB0B1E|nr:hypothetical protein [Longitalea sp. SCSIO 12813]
MRLSFLFSFLAIAGSLTSFAQSDIASLEDRIIFIQEKMRDAVEDETRFAYHDSLRQTMTEVMNSSGSLEYAFDRVQYMSILTSSNGELRIFNWNMPYNDQTHTYGCFMLWLVDGKQGIYDWVELEDNVDDGSSVENKYLKPEKWQGALYYELIEVKKGRKKIDHYVLLGWDGANGLINRKVIEPFTINRGKVRLGAPVFDIPKKNPKRYVMEYSEEVMASLKYYPKEKRIVFDHLSPRQEGLEGNPAFYGPDMTYDSFNLEKTKWEYNSNVDITLDKEQSKRPYIDPRR